MNRDDEQRLKDIRDIIINMDCTGEHLQADILNQLATEGPHADHKQDLKAVNEFLLKVRKENW